LLSPRNSPPAALLGLEMRRGEIDIVVEDMHFIMHPSGPAALARAFIDGGK